VILWIRWWNFRVTLKVPKFWTGWVTNASQKWLCFKELVFLIVFFMKTFGTQCINIDFMEQSATVVTRLTFSGRPWFGSDPGNRNPKWGLSWFYHSLWASAGIEPRIWSLLPLRHSQLSWCLNAFCSCSAVAKQTTTQPTKILINSEVYMNTHFQSKGNKSALKTSNILESYLPWVKLLETLYTMQFKLLYPASNFGLIRFLRFLSKSRTFECRKILFLCKGRILIMINIFHF
jgi:hypothetical protein